jgi:hypothetical protein
MTKQRVSLKTLFLFIALLGLARILPAKSPESKLSSTDRARLEQMIADYRTGWLTGDRQKILDLFADDATITERSSADHRQSRHDQVLVAAGWFHDIDPSL